MITQILTKQVSASIKKIHDNVEHFAKTFFESYQPNSDPFFALDGESIYAQISWVGSDGKDYCEEHLIAVADYNKWLIKLEGEG